MKSLNRLIILNFIFLLILNVVTVQIAYTDINVPFDGMYLDYKVTVKRKFPLSTMTGRRYSKFIETEDYSKMKIIIKITLESETLDFYYVIIDVNDRIIVESTKSEDVGLICWELWPVPMEIGDDFNIKAEGGVEPVTVTGSETIIVMGRRCNCWVVKGLQTTSWVEKTTGVTVKEVFEDSSFKITHELADTNIQNFPPASGFMSNNVLTFIAVTAIVVFFLIIVIMFLRGGKKAPLPYPTPDLQPLPPQPPQALCPYCGKPLTWIPQYRRWYCFNCRRYF